MQTNQDKQAGEALAADAADAAENARLHSVNAELLEACRNIAGFNYATCESNYGEQVALQEFAGIKRQARRAIARAEAEGRARFPSREVAEMGTTLTNSFHKTEKTVRKSAEEIDYIDNKIWSGQELTPAEKAWVRKVRNTLCGILDCICGDNFSRRG